MERPLGRDFPFASMADRYIDAVEELDDSIRILLRALPPDEALTITSQLTSAVHAAYAFGLHQGRNGL
jgi:hypothetical protein